MTAAVRRRVLRRDVEQPPAGIGHSGAGPAGEAPMGTTRPGGSRSDAGSPAPARYPLGAEIAAAGDRAAAVFAASARVSPPESGRHIDLLLVDTSSGATRTEGVSDGPRPAVAVLDEMRPQLAVPAFDPAAVNPIGWTPDHSPEPVTLQSLWPPPVPDPAFEHLGRDLFCELMRHHHVTDCGTGWGHATARAGTLAALAAAGVVVHLAQPDPDLRLCLGAELHDLMCGDALTSHDSHGREQLSIAMRRLALRDHSLRARARQILTDQGMEAPLAEVSVLLPTRRPELLATAVEAVRVQNYPRLELVLGLHGEGFPDDADIMAMADDLGGEVRVVRVDQQETLGDVLNAAVAASSGTLLTKFDDDDFYAPDHIWDLVLAREYSGATLVAKAPEYVYLSETDSTVRVSKWRERFVPRPLAAGGVLLISRQDLYNAGGWRRVPRKVDTSLAQDVALLGGDIYWTHGTGYLRVRHGDEQTWDIDDDFFLSNSSDSRPGRDFEFAGF